MEPNDFRGESSSSSVSAKKKLRKTKCHRGPKPFAKRYKYAKICTERCERILRFFKHQSRLTGIPVTNLVSQSLSRRQVRIESLHEMTGKLRLLWTMWCLISMDYFSAGWGGCSASTGGRGLQSKSS